MPIALTRAVSPRIEECELTHVDREPIDTTRARRQHGAYEAALRRLGIEVRRVAPAPEHPDGVFIEDTAVVLDELAVIARPGAPSRRGEVGGVAEALAGYRPVARVPAPATLDGGDVLVDGRTVFVGESVRTNGEAHDWLRGVLGPLGYQVVVVPVTRCLHLKTGVTSPAAGTFLVNPDWVSPTPFVDAEIIEVDPAEPFAANVLRAGDAVLVAAGAPRTRRRLERLGLEVAEVDVSELARAEAGVTCCSVLVPDAAGPGGAAPG